MQYSNDDNNSNENNHNKNNNNNERHTIIHNIVLWMSFIHHYTLILLIDLMPMLRRVCEVKHKELNMIDCIKIN